MHSSTALGKLKVLLELGWELSVCGSGGYGEAVVEEVSCICNSDYMEVPAYSQWSGKFSYYELFSPFLENP